MASTAFTTGGGGSSSGPTKDSNGNIVAFGTEDPSKAPSAQQYFGNAYGWTPEQYASAMSNPLTAAGLYANPTGDAQPAWAPASAPSGNASGGLINNAIGGVNTSRGTAALGSGASMSSVGGTASQGFTVGGGGSPSQIASGISGVSGSSSTSSLNGSGGFTVGGGGTTASSGTGSSASGTGSATVSVPTKPIAAGASDTSTGNTTSTSTGTTTNTSGTGAPTSATTTNWNVTPSQTVAGQASSVIAANSPLMQQAAAQATQAMNDRGLVNSTISAQAAQDAVLNRAIQIGSQDASTNAASAQTNAAAANSTSQFNAAQSNNYDLTTTQNELNRQNAVALAKLNNDSQYQIAEMQQKYSGQLQKSQAFATMFNNYIQQLAQIDQDTSITDPGAKLQMKLQAAQGLDQYAAVAGMSLGSTLDPATQWQQQLDAYYAANPSKAPASWTAAHPGATGSGSSGSSGSSDNGVPGSYGAGGN